MVDRSPGLFDLDDRLAELSAKGTVWSACRRWLDFEMFRPALEAAVPLSMARRISSEVAPQNSPVRRAGISRWVERLALHCWAAFRDVLVWTG